MKSEEHVIRSEDTEDTGFLNRIQMEDCEHLELPKCCSEKTKAVGGEQCRQMFMGLFDQLVQG